MAGAIKRRRLEEAHASFEDGGNLFASSSLTPLTLEERAAWNGFCEIESEPAFFNVMLRDFGVKGVKVQEVISLDEEMLQFLHKPIYGLIFLFRWKEDDPHKQELSCPEHIWFANQTSEYACATVALLNIVNNVEGLELGEELARFKEFTKSFTPALRGIAINNFEFVKRIHNSFARKMDIFSVDLQLKNQATEKRRGGKAANVEVDESESGFHFIAFVPVKGELWKFDGLERQPQNLGKCDDEWLDLATPEIQARMAEYEEDQIEFAVLSVGKDPSISLTSRLCSNIKSLNALDARLSELGSEAAASDSENGTLSGPDVSYGVTKAALDEAELLPPTKELLSSSAIAKLREHRSTLAETQRELRASLQEERQSFHADEQYAAQRRHDYSPAVEQWIRILARKGNVEHLAAESLLN
ncbi:hypothetical protein KEM55_007275 [Ascosphaera atra]|nr:hypothetical protein KEM55_007275 [Ascosphaera atra]